MAKHGIKSEITGTVWKIVAQTGQKLEAGDTVMILESMKMEIPVVVEDPGTLASILVKEGDAIQEGQEIAVIES